MNILIINKEHVIEFKYNKDAMRLVKELYTQLDEVHFQQISCFGSSLYVHDHEYLISDLIPKHKIDEIKSNELEALESHPSGNPF